MQARTISIDNDNFTCFLYVREAQFRHILSAIPLSDVLIEKQSKLKFTLRMGKISFPIMESYKLKRGINNA